MFDRIDRNDFLDEENKSLSRQEVSKEMMADFDKR